MNMGAVFTLMLYLAISYFIGAFTAFSFNPGDWSLWLRALSAVTPFVLWVIDLAND